MPCVDKNNRRVGLPMGQIILLLKGRHGILPGALLLERVLFVFVYFHVMHVQYLICVCIKLEVVFFHFSVAAQLLELTTPFYQTSFRFFKYNKGTRILITEKYFSKISHRVNLMLLKFKKSRTGIVNCLFICHRGTN